MATKTKISTMKPIRFKNDLLKTIDAVMNEDESFAAFVRGACKELATSRLHNMARACNSKVCKECGKTKPLTDFPKDSNRPKWSGPKCIPCTSEYSAQNYRKRQAAKDKVK